MEEGRDDRDGAEMGSELSIDIHFEDRLMMCAMARPLRIEYPGAIYHVLSRGDRHEAIFRTENLYMGTWTHVSNRLDHSR
jgi:hypothetical protein